jgi:phage shock protein B
MVELSTILFFIFGLPCILATILVLVTLFFIFFGTKNRARQKEESQLVVELTESMDKLGKRIEVLETILAEERRERTNK